MPEKLLTINKFSDRLDLIIEELENLRKQKIEAQSRIAPGNRNYNQLTALIEEIDRVLIPLKACGDRVHNWESKEKFIGLNFFDS